MKIKFTIETELEMDFPGVQDPTGEISKQFTLAFEAGWRFGVARDIQTLRDVYDKMFKHPPKFGVNRCDIKSVVTP